MVNRPAGLQVREERVDVPGRGGRTARIERRRAPAFRYAAGELAAAFLSAGEVARRVTAAAMGKTIDRDAAIPFGALRSIGGIEQSCRNRRFHPARSERNPKYGKELGGAVWRTGCLAACRLKSSH